jgi:hypothetical protein
MIARSASDTGRDVQSLRLSGDRQIVRTVANYPAQATPRD